jgi:aryl-alcohol dehydrogenase-like predicted oxidoreductase
MIYRKLGRTGLDVGIIGLGAEHLEHQPMEAVKPVVDEALAGGVNYIDLFMPSLPLKI